jgi:histidinol phosphatase-like enzyme
MWGQNQRAVIAGFDGVIAWRTRGESAQDGSDFEFLPGALEGLRLLRENQYTVMAVARDKPNRNESQNDSQRFIQRMRLEVALDGGKIEQMYVWREGEVAYSELLKRMMAEHGLRATNTALVSDSVDELETGGWLGCQGILLRREVFLDRGWREGVRRWEVVSNLSEAAECLIIKGFLGQAVEGGKAFLAKADIRNEHVG